MTPTGQLAKIASTPKAGPFAMLRGPLGSKGTGAPKAVSLTLVFAVLGVLVFMSAPALAAAPETPGLEVVPPPHATEVELQGTLNPAVEGEAASYHFIYRAGASCVGGSETLPLTSLGAKPETVAETLTGLTAGTQYTACLVDEASPTEIATSAPVTFKTATQPATPEATTATPLTGTTATLNGILNPGAPGDPGKYQFLYRPSGANECQGPGETPSAEGESTGEENEPAELAVEGLKPDTTYAFCLLARNNAGETSAVSTAVSFTTAPVKPTLSDEVAKNLTATTADLTGRVNPEGTDTTYRFEYGPTTAYGTSTTPADAGAGFAEVPVTGHLKELTAGQTYHWRLVAENGAGETTSVDHTFVYTTAAEPLPDGRRYEMVTPVDKNGAVFGALFNAESTHVARDGEAATASVVQCFAGAESCNAVRDLTGSTYEFHRTSTGWITRPLALPASSGEGQTTWLSGFSMVGGEERATALISTQLPESVADEFIAREPDGTVQPVGPIAENTSFLTAVANQPSDATADLSHIVYQTRAPLWSFDKTNAEKQGLYEYVGRHQASPVLVAVNGGPGSQEPITGCGTELLDGTYKEALSGDGRTIYFNTVECNGPSEPTEVYARIDQARTVQISEHAASGCGTTCMAAPPGNARFQGASADGEVAFFTSGRQLTDDASEDPGTNSQGCNATTTGCNLYESRCPDHCENPAERTLIDVSAGDTSGLGPQVQGTVAIPPNGSGIFFVAKGVLTEEQNSEGASAQPGALNLYDYQSPAGGGEGHTRFIGTLSAGDRTQIGQLRDNVTPDGRFLVFTSHRALTRDDTRPEGPAQVYRYDSLTHTLLRISVGRDGFNDDGNSAVADASIVKASIFGSGSGGNVGPGRTNPTLSDDGQYVFFETPTGLTPDAPDSAVASTQEFEGGVVQKEYAQNIYEYREGHVSLITDGKDLVGKPKQATGSVELLGVSASGADVLFQTASQLVPQDTDTQRDLYDAHICSEASPCPPSAAAPAPPCHEEECHGPAAAGSSPPAAASESFSGPGNLTATVTPPPVKRTAAQLRAQHLTAALRACHKLHARSRRKACERTARKRYGPAHAAGAADSRRRR